MKITMIVLMILVLWSGSVEADQCCVAWNGATNSSGLFATNILAGYAWISGPEIDQWTQETFFSITNQTVPGLRYAENGLYGMVISNVTYHPPTYFRIVTVFTNGFRQTNDSQTLIWSGLSPSALSAFRIL